MKLHKKSLSLALGYLSAGMHFLWVLAVWTGLAQAIADLWHGIHFIGDHHEVLPATFGTAVIGVLSAFIIGYVSGWAFGILLERFEK